MFKISYTSARRVVRSCAPGATACLTIALFVFLLTGCGSAQLAATAGHVAMVSMEDYEAGLLEQQLRDEEQQWHGTPYRWGGTSRNGVDCSGFVMNVYQDLFDLPLPRTTTALVQTGRPIPAEDLQAGDLVFFRTSRKTRHVGIYLGAGEFAHASTSEGVTTSHLDDRYWQRTYWTSRRILPARSADASAPLSSAPSKVDSSMRRTGW